MKPADGRVKFTEWLPDLPDLDNPGLTTATNVLPIEGSYRPFKTLGEGASDALDSEPIGGIATELYTYIGIKNSLVRALLGSGSWTDYSQATYASATFWNFIQFDDFIIAHSDANPAQVQTIGDSNNFANLATTGTCPAARAIGKVGRFVMVGDTVSDDREAYVRWSAIGAPRDWSTPGTSTARALQAGEQFLRGDWGPVKAIFGGDQFGIVFQQLGLTRITYIGGDAVFQFDELEGSIGTEYPHSVVAFDGGWYYLSRAGFFFTDGVKCVPIGAGKVDRYFATSARPVVDRRVWGAVDANRKLIYWAINRDNSNNFCEVIFAYDTQTQRFTLCEQNLNCLLAVPVMNFLTPPQVSMYAFNTDHEGCFFDGTVGTATITTGETELHPGGRTFVQGIKPLVSLVAGVTPTITVAMAARSSQDADDVSFSAESTPNSRTGFAGFRSDAQYHRARLTITGEFDEAMGIEYQAVPSGST